jgi:hypothetical protein
LDVFQRCEMYRLKVTAASLRLDQLLPAALTFLRVLLVHISHALRPDVKSKANGILGVLHVAATLHDVLRQQVKGDRAIDLLEEPAEEAKVVVFPLNLAGDLVNEL